MDTLQLTDDEFVALAADFGAPRAVILPTVNALEAGQLDSASFRGHRSLYVRSLLDQNGAAIAPVAELFTAAVTAESSIEVYLGDDSLERASWALTSLHYAGPPSGHWLLDTVNPVGLHTLTRSPVDEQRRYIEGMITATFDTGPERVDQTTPTSDAPRPSCLCLRVATDSAVTTITVRRGDVQVHRPQAATALTPTSPGDDLARADPAAAAQLVIALAQASGAASGAVIG